MSDQVAMVWVLRNKKTRKMLQQWLPILQREPTTLIWSDSERTIEFLKVLEREDEYEPCFVLLDAVMAVSGQVTVNPLVTAKTADSVLENIDLTQAME